MESCGLTIFPIEHGDFPELCVNVCQRVCDVSLEFHRLIICGCIRYLPIGEYVCISILLYLRMGMYVFVHHLAFTSQKQGRRDEQTSVDDEPKILF